MMAKADKKITKPILISWFTNVVVIYLAFVFYPENIVLGNAVLSLFIAILIISLILALIHSLVTPTLIALKVKPKNKLRRLAINAVVNIVVLWIMARFATYTGFGISSFWVAIILGLVLTIIHFGIKTALVKK